MTTPQDKKRRDRGDDTIYWDKTNRCFVGAISLGYDTTGKRKRPSVRGRTRTEVKDRLKALHEEIKAGVRTPKTYTVEQCVGDWLDSLTLDPDTIAAYRGQAEKWIYPRIGKAKLKTLTAKQAERFLNDIGQHLAKRSLLMIKSTLVRSIRHAQKHDLISRNVAELADLPAGQPGRPSRAMTQPQAAKVLQAAAGRPSGYIEVVTISRYKQAASHVASRSGALACGNKPRKGATVAHFSDDLTAATCRACRIVLGLDEPADDLSRLAALFVVAITMGLRPGELRALRWDHVNLDQQVIYVWRSSRRGGDTKTPKSRRTLSLPQRTAAALRAHEKRQATEREAAGDLWQEHGLVFCREDGTPYTKDALNWQFGKITRRAGIGHWHAHESRHTAVSIMSNNGVPIQDIADAMGHKSTHVTETIYRHVIAPAIRGGAEIMDDVFGDVEEDSA